MAPRRLLLLLRGRPSFLPPLQPRPVHAETAVTPERPAVLRAVSHLKACSGTEDGEALCDGRLIVGRRTVRVITCDRVKLRFWPLTRCEMRKMHALHDDT